MAQREGDTAMPRQPARRRMRPTNLAAVAILAVVLALAVWGWTHYAGALMGRGPAGQPDDRGTTRQEAEARSRGQDPRGSNPSQDAYTSQNQSREPSSR